MLYRKIRDLTEDDPAHVESMVRDDDNFKKLCLGLGSVESRLRRAERIAQYRFAKAGGVAFISAWRDCERRYSKIVSDELVADWGLANWGYKGEIARLRARIYALEERLRLGADKLDRAAAENRRLAVKAEKMRRQVAKGASLQMLERTSASVSRHVINLSRLYDEIRVTINPTGSSYSSLAVDERKERKHPKSLSRKELSGFSHL